jgi:hypothetical protein
VCSVVVPCVTSVTLDIHSQTGQGQGMAGPTLHRALQDSWVPRAALLLVLAFPLVEVGLSSGPPVRRHKGATARRWVELAAVCLAPLKVALWSNPASVALLALLGLVDRGHHDLGLDLGDL